MRGGGTVLWFVLYLVFALYFINIGFSFFDIPKSFLTADRWISFAGGILLLLGAITSIRARSIY